LIKRKLKIRGFQYKCKDLYTVDLFLFFEFFEELLIFFILRNRSKTIIEVIVKIKIARRVK
jgi:hypothetical protein